MIPQLWKGSDLEKTGDKQFKGHHIARKHGIYAQSLKWEACHQDVTCVCCPEQKTLLLGVGLSHLNRDFQYRCRHCSISWTPRGLAFNCQPWAASSHTLRSRKQHSTPLLRPLNLVAGGSVWGATGKNARSIGQQGKNSQSTWMRHIKSVGSLWQADN